MTPWKDRQELFRCSREYKKRKPGQDRERHMKLGVIAHTCNPRGPWKWQQKD